MKTTAVFSREIFPVREWAIPIGDKQLKGYWTLPSSRPRVEHFYNDSQHFILLVALNDDVYVDGQEIKQGSCLFLPAGTDRKVHLLACSEGVEFLRLEAPDIPVFSSVHLKNKQLIALSPSTYYHIARILIHTTQVRQMGIHSQADGILLVQCCLNPSSFNNSSNIQFNEVFRLTECLQILQLTAKAKLTVAQLAALCKLKTYRLQQICQQTFGLTAHQVLRFIKMHTALKIIANQTQTLAAIGKDLEYSNDENFITAFREYYGLTPHSFRKLFTSFPYSPSGKL